MADQISQHGSGESVEEIDKREKTKRKKGHMALRNNVWETREELWEILKPTELRIVDAIISKTIKWRTDEAKITIQELMEKTKQKHTHVYTILKDLEAKGIILRRKVRHDLIIGLNPDFFGELLIKKHQDAVLARKNKVKIVVDNSKTMYENSTESVPNLDKTCTESVQVKYGSSTENNIQPPDITGESRSLNTLLKDISLKTSLKGGEEQKPVGNRFTLLGLGTKKKQSEQLEDREAEKQRQLRMLAAMETSAG